MSCICVFSSSSDVIDNGFFEIAKELGREIARRGDTMVYGGCNVGLMGTVARGVHEQGGKVVGVIPRFIHAKGLGYEPSDELIVTTGMRDRKAAMEARADAFIALPGGFGTLEEMLEIITLKQLQQHAKPIIFLNQDGFYDPLAALFEHMYERRFAKPVYREMYFFAPDLKSAFEYLDSYQPPVFENKWFRTAEI
ncbi:MAG TPA: TIGR00730 family Rossman fold protein [Terriglobales bacterium]|nr:TIGR00730 family Rossman fold protein [Terriglobales bacterium]